MCLITNQKEPTILEEDTIVYKLCKGRSLNKDNALAEFRNFAYKKGILNKTKITSKQGWHTAYDYKVTRFYASGCTDDLRSFQSGFHFATSVDRLIELRCVKDYSNIAKFLVPKGSKVVYDKTGLGISNKIKFIEWNS